MLERGQASNPEVRGQQRSSFSHPFYICSRIQTEVVVCGRWSQGRDDRVAMSRQTKDKGSIDSVPSSNSHLENGENPKLVTVPHFIALPLY